MNHPHDLEGGVPNRLPSSVVRELSELSLPKALLDLGLEWVGIVAAIAACVWTQNGFVYLFCVLFIGARQHALTILGHDASHFRFLPNRTLNDWVSNIFMQWPLFISVAGFRKFHGPHHRYFNEEGDGNRQLWKTHNEDGELNEEWTYPKTRRQLMIKLIRRSFFLTGIRWILRGLIGAFIVRDSWLSLVVRLVFIAAFATWFTQYDLWLHFLLLWIIPLCTWHVTIQYMRLISEHSVVKSDAPIYQETRTTIPPWWESLMIIPHHIGYHLEHHWYPSVPYYNLPKLHQTLMEQTEFAQSANISRSIFSSLKEVSSPTTG